MSRPPWSCWRLIARRWVLARDIALSVVAAIVTSLILIAVLGSHGGRPSGIVIDSYDLSFPVMQIAVFMAVATAALPYLARSLQRVIEVFIGLVALAGAVGGEGLPLNVLGSMAIGWAAALLIRLIFGSPLGLPSAADVQRLLADLGISAGDVRPLPRQAWGVAKYQATETGSPGCARASRWPSPSTAGMRRTPSCSPRWAGSCSTGTPGPSLTLTRLQQVEHEAFLTLRADQAGVVVPDIAEAGTAGPASDALLVCRLPPGAPLSGADAAEHQ